MRRSSGSYFSLVDIEGLFKLRADLSGPVSANLGEFTWLDLDFELEEWDWRNPDAVLKSDCRSGDLDCGDNGKLYLLARHH